ncbi:hypothetical protein CHUAL_000953 [Chamberlinius hualienensis]
MSDKASCTTQDKGGREVIRKGCWKSCMCKQRLKARFRNLTLKNRLETSEKSEVMKLRGVQAACPLQGS